MLAPFKHFAATLVLAAAVWISAFAALVALDESLGPRSEPLLLLPLGLLFTPTLIFGLWAYASASLPTWPNTRIRLAWLLGVLPLATLVLLLGARLDPALLILCLTLVGPLLALTGIWLERRRSR